MGIAIATTYACDGNGAGCLQPAAAVPTLNVITAQLSKNGGSKALIQYCCANAACFTNVINAIKAAYAAMP